MRKDTFHTASPQHPLLQELVEYYYFHSSPSHFDQSYIYYPHYGNALNVYLDASVQWDEYGRVLDGSQPGPATCLLTCNREYGRKVRMRGAIRKLGIIFKPLGINAFLSSPLFHQQSVAVAPFTHFGTAFNELAEELFEVLNIEQRVVQLDQFLLARYIGFEEARLAQAIKLIFAGHGGITAKEVAQQVYTSRRTLLRLFQRHCVCSITTFAAIVQFRLALHQYQQAAIKPRITDIALDNAYYDQAHLHRHYQKITGLSPRTLFRMLKQASDRDTYWGYPEW